MVRKSTIGAVVLLFAFILPAITLDARGQEGTAPPELNRTSLFLSEGMEMGPLEPETTDEFQAVSIPSGFIQEGLGPFKIIPVGDTVWKSVGTWYTPPLKKPVVLGGQVDVIAYMYKEESDGGSPTSEFLFEILRGNEVLLELNVGRTTLTEGQDIIVKAAGSFPSGNNTTVPAGTSIAFRVSAKSNGGGAVLRFGSQTYPSGFTFGSDALSIHNIRMDRRGVILEYKDAFMVPWTHLYYQLTVDKVIVPQDEVISSINPLNMTREILWERDNSVGEHEVFVSMGYSTGQNISEQKFIKVTQAKEKWFGIDHLKNMVHNNMGMFVIFILGLSSLLLYLRHRSKAWDRRKMKLGLKGSVRKREVKKTWKQIEKVRKERIKQERMMRIVETEDEDPDEAEERDFSLFRQRVKKSECAVLAEDIEELTL